MVDLTVFDNRIFNAGDIKTVLEGFQAGEPYVLGNVGGTANAITADLTPAISSYTDGMFFILRPTSSITGLSGATLNVNGLGAKNIKIYHPDLEVMVDVQERDMISGVPYHLIFDSTEDAVILINSSMPSVYTYSYGHNASLITFSGSGVHSNIGTTQNWYIPKNSYVICSLMLCYSVNTGNNRLLDFYMHMNGSVMANGFMQNDAPVKQGVTGWETTGHYTGSGVVTTGGTTSFVPRWYLADASTRYTYRYNFFVRAFPYHRTL